MYILTKKSENKYKLWQKFYFSLFSPLTRLCSLIKIDLRVLCNNRISYHSLLPAVWKQRVWRNLVSSHCNYHLQTSMCQKYKLHNLHSDCLFLKNIDATCTILSIAWVVLRKHANKRLHHMWRIYKTFIAFWKDMHWVKVTCVRRVDLSWSVDSVNLRGNEKLAAKGVFHMPLHNTHTIRNQQKALCEKMQVFDDSVKKALSLAKCSYQNSVLHVLIRFFENM